ncbi:MAG: c-type cytochrome [Gammaproteobacteria bacterium]
MRKLGKFITYFVFFLASVFTICTVSATETEELSETDSLLIDGQNEFQQKCAVCHGTEGKGDGPYSFALIFKPTDLTKLTAKNGGNFPFIETYLMIDGREMIKFHGTRLMPVWGDRYSQETWSNVSPEYANTLVRGRILELILYLYSIQETQ